MVLLGHRHLGQSGCSLLRSTSHITARLVQLQSIAEVKSQLETMHLIFNVPRFICSRKFAELRLKSDIRVPKSSEQIAQEESAKASAAEKSAAEKYCSRLEWRLPNVNDLLKIHPGSQIPFWQHILATVRVPVLDGASLNDAGQLATVKVSWPLYLELLSWWQLQRYYIKVQKTVRCKQRADIVTVHPFLQFKNAAAKGSAEWLDACKWMLLGYCNHGEGCGGTFANYQELVQFSEDRLLDLAERFVRTPDDDRFRCRMTKCPPHVAKSYILGQARKQRLEARKLPTEGSAVYASAEVCLRSCGLKQHVACEAMEGHVQRGTSGC